LLYGIDGEASRDPPGDVDGSDSLELFGERALAARIVGDRKDGDEVATKRLERFVQMTRRVITLRLREVMDPADEIRLGIGDERIDGKAPFTPRDDVRAPIGEGGDRDDPRFRADPVRYGGRPDVGAGPDENDAEGTLALDRTADEQPVPRLEDVQW